MVRDRQYQIPVPLRFEPLDSYLGPHSGSASGGALRVCRKATRASLSNAESLRFFSVTFVASPPWRRMASFKVAALPSWKYGAESATPHKGGVFHSLGSGWSFGSGTSGVRLRLP